MMKAFALSIAALLCASPAASAQVVVGGTSIAKDCFQKTKYGDPGRTSTIKLCENALDILAMSKKDRAATHINTAILYMRSEQYAKAERHYDDAIKLKPKLPEAYISLAANRIYQGEYEDALSAVNTGINLGTDKMPEALYNRAIAYHRLGQYKEAYYDLKEALVLRPDWDVAVKAIGHYDVVSKPASG